MPVVNFHIIWPDNKLMKCYSPSSVITQHLIEGEIYALSDFMTRVRHALHLASERVRERYGYTCSAAADQLEILERDARKYKDLPNATVKVTLFS